MNNLKRIFSSGKNKKDEKNHRSSKKSSYSQCGEDLIINFIFEQLRKEKPTYLDIGAHHPSFLSNTFFFYEKGSRGVNVEPDPYLMESFLQERSLDTNLNIGVGTNLEETIADFYVMSERVLNTFSEDEAKKISSYGTYTIEKVIQVPLIPIKQIIQEHFITNPPNFISIDVEGLDFEIMKTFDFNNHRPEVFCIETITYTEDKTERKLTEIIELMKANHYFVYADTYINTIFVDSNSWLQR